MSQVRCRVGVLWRGHRSPVPAKASSAMIAGDMVISAERVSKSFGRKAVLRNISLTLHKGEVLCIVGENGSGKTTLLAILASLQSPDHGEVRTNATIGYCPQQVKIFDQLTADEHLILFGTGCGLERFEALERGRQILAALGFPTAERTTIAKELSGGTCQKLNLGLALLGEPSLLLLDEPYQGFDRGSYLDFWEHVKTWRREGRGVIIVTHALAELDRADSILELTVASSSRR